MLNDTLYETKGVRYIKKTNYTCWESIFMMNLTKPTHVISKNQPSPQRYSLGCGWAWPITPPGAQPTRNPVRPCPSSGHRSPPGAALRRPHLALAAYLAAVRDSALSLPIPSNGRGGGTARFRDCWNTDGTLLSWNRSRTSHFLFTRRAII